MMLDAGARGGLRGALPLAAGVVTGSLIMLVAAWLGARFWRRGSADGADRARSISPVAIAAQQWINPKAWMLVMTVAAAGTPFGISVVLAVTAAVTAVCLLLWAGAGASLLQHLRAPHRRLVFDRALGGLLIMSAMGVLSDAVR